MIVEVLPLLTAFGLGSIVTALVQSYLSKRSLLETRNFEERKQAYIGLIEAYHWAAVEQTDAAAKEFAYWQMRSNLVAPNAVRKAITEIVDSNEDLPRRHVAHEALMVELRRHLGVAI